MPITHESVGTAADGTTIERYTLTNTNGLRANVLTYGGTLVSLHAPDRAGTFGDVLLGFDTLAPYLGQHPFFGSLVGRFGNRIARGRFELDGTTYKLPINDGPNHLHGGPGGFHQVVWRARELSDTALELQHTSPDGDQGYPGALDVTVVYTLNDANELRIDYTATTDAPTVLNLTNHAYFNLAGSGDILDHEVELFASRFVPVDDTLIPTGELRPVRGTPMDFSTPTPIGAHIDDDDEQLRLAQGGFDHCWVLDKTTGDALQLAARVYEPTSGRVLETWTTQPGVQFYTGNFLDGVLHGKNDVTYTKHKGLCLETQHFPDAPNQPSFPSTVLRPGETYQQTTVYRLSVR